MRGDILIPNRKQTGTIKLNPTDNNDHRYLSDIIDNNSIVFVDSEHIGTANSIQYNIVEYIEDISNNVEIIKLKDQNQIEIRKITYFYSNLIGASILNKIETEDYISHKKIIEDFSYSNQYTQITVSKTITTI